MNKKLYFNSTRTHSACSSAMDWRTPDGFSNYLVSECGDVVVADKDRRLKGSIDYDGYHSYKLTADDGKKRQISAHRLVAIAFLGPQPHAKSQVRHLNGSKINCHFSNLAWGTPIENRQDTVQHGTSPTRGVRNPKAKINDDDVRQIRKDHRDIKEGRLDKKVSDLANQYGLHISTICNIANGKAWPHVK